MSFDELAASEQDAADAVVFEVRDFVDGEGLAVGGGASPLDCMKPTKPFGVDGNFDERGPGVDEDGRVGGFVEPAVADAPGHV